METLLLSSLNDFLNNLKFTLKFCMERSISIKLLEIYKLILLLYENILNIYFLSIPSQNSRYQVFYWKLVIVLLKIQFCMISGVSSSATVVTSLCVTAKFVRTNGCEGGSIYSLVTFTDKLISGAVVLLVQNL